VENFDGDTYRAVYTIRFREAVYVLHAFKKKSKRSIKTPQTDIELIKRRLRDAEADHALRFTESKHETESQVDVGSGNIFADLACPTRHPFPEGPDRPPKSIGSLINASSPKLRQAS